eukprot:1630159-Prorocentrum_lima.AAC.1
MTSSLVGSEMCIRDRVRRTRACNGALCVRKTVSIGEWGCDAMHVSEAVSYTHLTLPTICSV